MPRLALLLAFGAMLAAGLPSPGLYLAIGLGVAAVGTGWLGYANRSARGTARLAAATAMAVGLVGVALGTARVLMVLAAIDRLTGTLAS